MDNSTLQTKNIRASVARLCIVVPCYNEEDVLPITSGAFLDKVEELYEKGLAKPDSSVMFVDDGSSDATWSIIEKLSQENSRIEGVKLSRNCGHQNALLAGLMEALRDDYDVTISIDCDGQDDINAMDEMMRSYYAGSEIVYGVRGSRDTDAFFKRFTAESFYKLMNKMDVETVFNHADYRLMSKKAIEALSQFGETNLFLRGMVPLIGFESSSVEYERHERLAGESHYPLGKMVGLALNGITSLSDKPIRLISSVGIGLSALSLVGIIWAIVVTLMGNAVAGWASTLCAVLFIGGLQLLALGIIGEYIGRIYLESKRRPRYIVEKRATRIAKS